MKSSKDRLIASLIFLAIDMTIFLSLGIMGYVASLFLGHSIGMLVAIISMVAYALARF